MAANATFLEGGSWVEAVAAMAQFAYEELSKIMMIGALQNGAVMKCSEL